MRHLCFLLFSHWFDLQQKFTPHVKVKVSFPCRSVSLLLSSAKLLSPNLLLILWLPLLLLATQSIQRYDFAGIDVRFLLNRDLGLLEIVILFLVFMFSFYLCCCNGASGFSRSALFTFIVSCISWSSMAFEKRFYFHFLWFTFLSARVRVSFHLCSWTLVLSFWWLWRARDWWFDHSVLPCFCCWPRILVFPSIWICDFNIFFLLLKIFCSDFIICLKSCICFSTLPLCT